MDISDASLESLTSLRQAMSMTIMRKSMGKDAQTISTLLKSMQSSNANIIEQSVTPHKGGNLDIKV